MSRGLSSAIKTQLASSSFVMAHLVKLEFNTTYKYTDFSSDIDAGSGEIYSANGFLQSMGSINESSKLTIGSIDLVLSGVNQTLISDLLNNGHLNKKVTIQRAYINSSTNALIEAFSIFSGRVDGMQIRDTNETSEIGLTISNHWSDFGRRSGRRTISSSQQQFFPDDKGYDFITKANLN